MPGTDKWASAPVSLDHQGTTYRIRRVGDITPFDSSDPDSKRVWWSDGGVHQNLTFPVQPDPISGMHCWHQVVTVTLAEPSDSYGDVVVDQEKAFAVYREWLAKAHKGPFPGGVRRPLHFARAVRPADSAYKI
jgi:hypothetical protein